MQCAKKKIFYKKKEINFQGFPVIFSEELIKVVTNFRVITCILSNLKKCYQ